MTYKEKIDAILKDGNINHHERLRKILELKPDDSINENLKPKHWPGRYNPPKDGWFLRRLRKFMHKRQQATDIHITQPRGMQRDQGRGRIRHKAERSGARRYRPAGEA